MKITFYLFKVLFEMISHFDHGPRAVTPNLGKASCSWTATMAGTGSGEDVWVLQPKNTKDGNHCPGEWVLWDAGKVE